MADQDAMALISELVEGIGPGGLVTKFVLVAEGLNGDGERVAWVDTHEHATRWDPYGLLTWALNEEAADQTVAVIDEAGE